MTTSGRNPLSGLPLTPRGGGQRIGLLDPAPGLGHGAGGQPGQLWRRRRFPSRAPPVRWWLRPLPSGVWRREPRRLDTGGVPLTAIESAVLSSSHPW